MPLLLLQEQEAMGHRSELDRLRLQRDELASMLGQHRQTVRPRGRFTQPAAAMCCPVTVSQQTPHSSVL